MRSIIIKSSFVLLLFVPMMSSTVNGAPLEYDPGTLSFSTTDQSMWDTGDGVAPQTKTYSTGWSASTSFGGIVGSAGRGSYWTREWIPIPWIECHGFLCKDSHTHSGFWQDLWVPPIPDTRTGIEFSLTTNGSVGLTSSLGFNGGTVGASVDFATRLSLPDEVRAGEYFSLSPTSTTSAGSLDSKFPTLTGEMSFSLHADASTTTKICALGAGCSEGTYSLLNINADDLNILKINTADLPPDTMSVFGLDALAFDVTRGTIWTDLAYPPPRIIVTLPGGKPPPSLGIGANIGNIELDYPDLVTTGDLSGEKVVSSGTFDNIVRVNADLDIATTAMLGTPLLGGVVYAGPLTFRGDLIDIDIGPTIDLTQNFELIPNLMIDLIFDHAVLIGDIETTFWSGALSDLPDIALHDLHQVTATPTYWLDALLKNQTSLDFDLTFSADILKGVASLSVLSSPTFSLVDLDYPFISFGSEDIFNKSFALAGFDPITTSSFTLRAISSGPSPSAIPEPGSLLLLIIGLAGLRFSFGRGRKV